MRERLTAPLRWVASPAVDANQRLQGVGFLVLRVTFGLMWLYNVAWKRAPNFGSEAGNGLYVFTSYAVEHPVLPPYAWLVENLVLPNIVPFGYAVLASETALAVLLLTGTYVRAAAALGVVQSTAIALSVAFAPDEWPWAYWMMIAGHIVLLLGASARRGGVDAVRAGLTSVSFLARFWGVLAVVVGAYSAVLSLDDPLAARGPVLRNTDVAVGLGEYNLVGGLAMVVIGLLLLAGSRTNASSGLPIAAAVLAILSAVSLHVQLGFSDPLLGGSPTSAAVFLCMAVVAGVLAATARRQARP